MDLFAGHRGEGKHRRAGVEVHHAVDDQRGGLADVEAGRYLAGSARLQLTDDRGPRNPPM